MHKKFNFLIVSLVGLLWCLNVCAQYSFQSIPNPKRLGSDHYVSDPDGNLSRATIEQLDAISTRIEKANGSEFAIVVVNDYRGGSDFDFALNLFTHWGIGKKGSDNGLLLFLVMNRHRYRFISGYGVEGIFPDILLHQIGETYLVPYLKAGDTDKAVLAAAKAVESVFLSPDHAVEMADLEAYRPTFWNLHAVALSQCLFVLTIFVIGYGWLSLARKHVLKKYGITPSRYQGRDFWAALFGFFFILFISLFPIAFLEVAGRVYTFGNLPYFLALFCMLWLFFHSYTCLDFIQKSTKDIKTGLEMRVSFIRLTCLPLLLSPFAYKTYFDLARDRKKIRSLETPPDASGAWSRLNRNKVKPADLKKYLNKLQLQEEKIGSKWFEIWLNKETQETRVAEFPGKKIAKYDVCPQCHGQTLMKPVVEVRKRATRTRTGEGERTQECVFCGYQIDLGAVTLPMLSSSSGSGSGSGGGGSSSSSGSSFGGGSSGGGGAGGSW